MSRYTVSFLTSTNMTEKRRCKNTTLFSFSQNFYSQILELQKWFCKFLNKQLCPPPPQKKMLVGLSPVWCPLKFPVFECPLFDAYCTAKTNLKYGHKILTRSESESSKTSWSSVDVDVVGLLVSTSDAWMAAANWSSSLASTILTSWKNIILR